jgi:hypothetical protein
LGDVVRRVIPDGEAVADAVVEGTRRFTVGKLSREHAEALKNYAEAEKAHRC